MEEGEGSSTETASEGATVSVSKLNLQPHHGAEPGHYDPNRYRIFLLSTIKHVHIYRIAQYTRVVGSYICYGVYGCA